MKLSIHPEKQYVIAVLAPHKKTNYSVIMPYILKSLGIVQNLSEKQHDEFIFIHDGVTQGTAGYLIETINKIQTSAKQFKEPKTILYRRLPLDIELNGRNSQYVWIDDALKLEPDLMLILQPPEWEPAKYAARHAKRLNVNYEVIPTEYE